MGGGRLRNRCKSRRGTGEEGVGLAEDERVIENMSMYQLLLEFSGICYALHF